MSGEKPSSYITNPEENQETSDFDNLTGYYDFLGEKNINDETGKERTFSEFDRYPRMPGESSEEYGKRLKWMHEKTAEMEAKQRAKEAASRAIVDSRGVRTEKYAGSDSGKKELEAEFKFDHIADKLERAVQEGRMTEEHADKLLELQFNKSLGEIDAARQNYEKGEEPKEEQPVEGKEPDGKEERKKIVIKRPYGFESHRKNPSPIRMRLFAEEIKDESSENQNGTEEAEEAERNEAKDTIEVTGVTVEDELNNQDNTTSHTPENHSEGYKQFMETLSGVQEKENEQEAKTATFKAEIDSQSGMVGENSPEEDFRKKLAEIFNKAKEKIQEILDDTNKQIDALRKSLEPVTEPIEKHENGPKKVESKEDHEDDKITEKIEEINEIRKKQGKKPLSLDVSAADIRKAKAEITANETKEVVKSLDLAEKEELVRVKGWYDGLPSGDKKKAIKEKLEDKSLSRPSVEWLEQKLDELRTENWIKAAWKNGVTQEEDTPLAA